MLHAVVASDTCDQLGFIGLATGPTRSWSSTPPLSGELPENSMEPRA